MAAYDDLTARLDELETNLAFTSLAVSLRPQLNRVLRWDGAPETVALSRKFMDTKARVENIYGALLIQSVATFERFLRALIDDTATKTADISKNYAEVKEHVRNRHAVLTGKLLSSLEAPLDYQAVDVKQLAENLASCVSGRSPFRLNASAFAAVVSSGKSEIIDRALANLGIGQCWDAIGRTPELQKILRTKGARETRKATIRQLDELD